LLTKPPAERRPLIAGGVPLSPPAAHAPAFEHFTQIMREDVVPATYR
jgi:hypothetical protein